MYYRYFGLNEAPFSISVSPRYLFMSDRHRDALAHLLYGVGVGGGFILLTGEVGTGKTTINRCVLEQLPENTDIALVLNPALNAIELLATVCDELGIEYSQEEQNLKALTDKLHQFLLNNHSKDRNTVLLIDEAQHLSFDVLEQIRLLTNLETNTKKLLQIILVGQPELRTLLAKPELRQLAQRITARYQLKPLTLQETESYIRHRLNVAGAPANQELFPPKVVKRLHKTSRGIPRLINVLCDRMLLGAYGQNKTVVDIPILEQATKEVLGEEEQLDLKEKPRYHYYGLAAVGLSAVVAGAVAWWQFSTPLQPAVSTSTQKPRPDTTIVQDPLPTLPADTEAAIAEQHQRQTTATDSAPWFNDQRSALDELLKVQNLSVKAPDTLCNKPASQVVGDNKLTAALILCEQQTVETWQDLQSYNRPAVLTLITPSRRQQYATLVAIDNNEAILSSPAGSRSRMSLDELGRLWNGDFVFIWQAAPHFKHPVGLNDSGPMVKWLASQFARIDQKNTLLAENTFNQALTKRVKMFQSENNLSADGLVGLKTLLKINEALGIDKTLDITADDSSQNPISPAAKINNQVMVQPKEG